MNAVVQFQPPRLPYHDAIEERFGVDKSGWKALVESIFPSARSPDSVLLALSYCRARNLDIFKRPVHIVPMWDSKRGDYVETVWPGIAEFRTTAMRTGQYAGCEEVTFGPDVETTFEWNDKKRGSQRATVTFPEYACMTVYRLVGNMRVAFPGPKAYWTETCATRGAQQVPNDMWMKRPRGQIEKCAEAAALRRAFPEELGNQYAAEEMDGRVIDGESVAQTVPVETRTLHADADDMAVAQDEAPKRARRTKAEMEAARAAEAEERGHGPENPQPVSETIENVLDGDDIPDHLRRLAGGGPLADVTDAEIQETEAEPASSVSEPSTETEAGSRLSGDGSTPETPSRSEPETEAQTSSDAPEIAPDLQTYIDAVDEPESWVSVKAAMKVFFSTETFRAMEPKGQNLIRGRTWDSVMEMGQRNPKETVDPGQDVSGFRLFVEWSEDPEALEGTYAFLRTGEAWGKTPSSAREMIDAAVTARVAFLCDPIGG